MNSTQKRFFIFLFLLCLNLAYRYFFIHYLTSSYLEFYYYSSYKSVYTGNCSFILSTINFYLFNNSFTLPLDVDDLNFYLLYCTDSKCVFKVFPTFANQLSFFNYYYNNVFFDVVPFFYNEIDNILFRKDIIILLKAHPLFYSANYLFVDDVSSLSYVQLVKRISVYNYMVTCYEKYLTMSNEHPGHLTDEVISIILQDYCQRSWFRIKLYTILRLLKFT